MSEWNMEVIEQQQNMKPIWHMADTNLKMVYKKEINLQRIGPNWEMER